MFKGGQKSGFPAAILSAMCSGDNSVEITEQESRFNAADEKLTCDEEKCYSAPLP